jgi:FkbM family methyltransferase
MRILKRAIKLASNCLARVASGNRVDGETGARSLRILRGPNQGKIFYTRNPEQSYALGYEPNVSRAIDSLLSLGEIMYDVGANEGWCSLIAASRTGYSGRIYAFEPDKSNLSVLKKNIETNQSQNIFVVNSGVGETSEILRFASYNLCGLVSHVITDEMQAASDASIYEIDVVSIDDFVLQGNHPPSLIKIDVEGLELKVLQGAQSTLVRVRPLVICEVRKDTWAPLSSFMSSVGYEARDLGGNGRGFDTFGLNDVLFSPQESFEPVRQNA